MGELTWTQQMLAKRLHQAERYVSTQVKTILVLRTNATADHAQIK